MLGLILLIFHVGIFKLPMSVLLGAVAILLIMKPNVLLYTSNCPDCFGNELCELIANGDVQLHWFSKLLLILQPALTKSVFFGKINGTRDIVLKSMTRRAQVPTKRYKSKERELFDSIIRDNILISDDSIQDVILCPNFRNIYLLFEHVDENVTNLMENRNLWLDIKISIEPLLLKFLSSVEGMPVPSYCGACGDVIAKEFKGKALNNYYDRSWLIRAFLSVQLLKMADLFTFHHENFIFYFTDISSDNIAVDATGMIYLTDLDHVIIAERRVKYDSDLEGKGIVHVSTVVDPIKLTFSPSDICKNAISDHNYFVVCRTILLYTEEMGQGLLSGIPSEFQRNHNLEKLLEECALPEKFDNRIVAGQLLKNALTVVTSHVEWKENL